ncbi:helicase with zinc finger domain-like [Oopsacas minuta]|uniref:Helicase with zinc finger domain-like n=1 Tax=Oopsacas minuta TaxID=111878 RepID=A0AAV7K9L9_9METZ|nr:helicase with zinc finger domain-like [Oopsacas minuta]
MNSFETHHVCEDCFMDTLSIIPPTLEKFRYRDGKCKTCGRQWVGIHVGYYTPHRKWYIIRPRSFNSELSMCRYKNGMCYRGCRRAHNQLELEMWIEDDRLLMIRKRPSKPKFGCVICQLEFRDNDNLNAHLMSKQHETRAYHMWILPDVGSSIRYTGPIRTRPRLQYGKDYELCRNFARKRWCQYGTGCKYAHSKEELTVWMDAFTARTFQCEDRRYNSDGLQEDMSSYKKYSSSEISEGGACRYPSESEISSQSWNYTEYCSSISSKFDGEPEHVREVYEGISYYGIEPCLRRFLKNIKINCIRSQTVTIEEYNRANNIKWVFYLKATQNYELNSIVLCDNKKIFWLGEIFKCSTKGSGRVEIKHKFVPNRTNYLLCQTFNQDSYFEISLFCKPEVVGSYKARIIFQIKDQLLLAREVKVKILGEGFKNICEDFEIITKQPPIRIPRVEELLKVNWEYNFKFVNTHINKSYQIPNFVEKNLNTGYYDNMPDEINKEYFVKRFHSLLYFEEFEHKRSLMRYDLPDQIITFRSVEKQITVERDYGRDRTYNAPKDFRYLTLKLNHRLFEGYRAFRPPKLAYFIPNGTKLAYEYEVRHMGAEYLIVLIHTELIDACQPFGGQAFVRFVPDRKDYIQMHEALELVRMSVLFPLHRKLEVPYSWGRDHLLELLENEKLSLQQKEAVYSIVDSNYQSFPTIICGPFGCGKTWTLSVAAKLISRLFHRAKILIVTKTNSSANLYIELLQKHFDTITMFRNKQGNKKIMFRHFSKSRSLQVDDDEVKAFANIEYDSYKGIKYYELEVCTIVVTTLVALASLLPPRARGRSQALFTHIFMDEAAQVIEPEACIALCLANDSTKIVLAGDVYQTKPLILSKYGKQYGLDESLLQRFEQLPAYETGALRICKIELRENFRSQETIVKFLSELFYDDSLIANPPCITGPTNYPALSFLHVSGDERRLHGFPSFYNKEEAELTILALRKFVEAGLKVENIGVLSTHKAQVRLIYEAVKEESRKCRTKGHTKDVCIQNNCISNRTINVRNLEGVQGREYDLVIVNTVRTLSDDMGELSMEDKLDLGLLDDVTQFNTILTRARGWVLVIGDMDCIQNVGECSNVWYKYIEACDNAKGLFRTSEEFKNFKMKAGVTKHETEKLGKEATKGSTNRVDKIDSISSYDIKYNSSQTFITTCQHDLENSQSSFSTDIITYGTDQNVIDTNQATPQSLLQHQGQDSAPMHSQIDWTDEATSFTDIVSVTQPTDDTSPTEYNSITKL